MGNEKAVTAERVELGVRLREARNYVGLSQEDVAAILHLNRSAISEIEKGQRRVDAIELKQFAQLYKLSVGHFTDANDTNDGLPEDVAHIARQVADLSPEDRAELGRFAEYLRSRTQLSKEDK